MLLRYTKTTWKKISNCENGAIIFSRLFQITNRLLFHETVANVSLTKGQEGYKFSMLGGYFLCKPMCWCLICQHWHDKYVDRCHFKADSRIAPSQWETVLLCNDVSRWVGAILESALHLIHHIVIVIICNIQIFCSLFSFYINICPFQVYTYIKNLNSLSTP